MIEIDEPPDVHACAPCGLPLMWLYSPRRQAWVCVVPGPAPDLLKVHPCRENQDFSTWRAVPHGDPPNEDYLAARDAIKSKNRIEEEQ